MLKKQIAGRAKGGFSDEMIGHAAVTGISNQPWRQAPRVTPALRVNTNWYLLLRRLDSSSRRSIRGQRSEMIHLLAEAAVPAEEIRKAADEYFRKLLI